MTEETQARIFKPFFTTMDLGTGQELSLSRTIIVEKHKGELLVESQYSVGTTMLIKLPLKS